MTTDTPFLAGHASASEWRDAADRIAADLAAATDDHRLGFLYVTHQFADRLGDAADYLRERTGVPHWVGTSGLGVCGAGKEYFDRPAMVAMAAPIAEDAFRVFAGVSTDIAPLTERHGAWLDTPTPPLSVVHGDPRNRDLARLIDDLCAATNGFLVGGLTVANESYPQVADGLEEGGLSGVMISLDSVPVQSGLTQGCSPISDVHEITEAQDNVIFKLDGRPAIEVFKEEIGEVLARDLRRVTGYIFAALPVSGSDMGDYLVRNLVGIDPDSGAIAIGEVVAPGDRVLFCRRDHDSAVADMRRMLGDLKKRTGNAPIRGGLYFSCCARGPNQFGPDSAELALVADALGEFPLAGFFANGEISNNRLYGYTGVLTLFL